MGLRIRYYKPKLVAKNPLNLSSLLDTQQSKHDQNHSQLSMSSPLLSQLSPKERLIAKNLLAKGAKIEKRDRTNPRIYRLDMMYQGYSIRLIESLELMHPAELFTHPRFYFAVTLQELGNTEIVAYIRVFGVPGHKDWLVPYYSNITEAIADAVKQEAQEVG